jgi:glutathionylspermidine amidase/synthetase
VAEAGLLRQRTQPGGKSADELAGAWKHSRARPFVHIMQDKDLEENYHALFIQRSLTQAGLKARFSLALMSCTGMPPGS